MIYPQHVFVAIAGLGLASAAPVRHTANSTIAHHALLASGHAAPLGYVQKIKESDYPEQCWQSWTLFNDYKCWCFTGCALDCSQGGEAGVAGTTSNPEWCTTVTDEDKKSCEELSCDLVANCDEVADDLKPGVDKIVSTGGYTCPTPATLNLQSASDFWLNTRQWCAQVPDPLPDVYPPCETRESCDRLDPVWETTKLEFFLDGKKLDFLPVNIMTQYSSSFGYPLKHTHLGVPGTLFCVTNLTPEQSESAFAAVFGTKPDGHRSWFSATDEGKALIPRIQIAVTK